MIYLLLLTCTWGASFGSQESLVIAQVLQAAPSQTQRNVETNAVTLWLCRRGEEGEGYPIATHQKERFDKQNPPRIVVKHYLIYLFKAYYKFYWQQRCYCIGIREHVWIHIAHRRKARERGRERYRMYSYT
jgi:hypothetical protein